MFDVRLAMPAIRKKDPPAKMNFEQFIEWAEAREGRWELHDGVPVRLHDPARGQSERFAHLRVKARVFRILDDAISSNKLDCEVVPDGATVVIDDEVSYEPDALVYCGKRMGDDDIVVPDPLIIVEVLSPSTAWKDIGDKLVDYFKLPSLAHYLIIDPRNKRIMHHFRKGDDIEAEAVNRPVLALEPPGIELDLHDLLGQGAK
jgi:Uma2 family endonuclease